MFSGTEAFRLGFADEAGDFDVAVARAEKLAGISDKARLIEFRPLVDFGDLFRLFGKSEAAKIKLDLGVHPPRIEAGKLYFLAPNFAQ